MLYYFIVYIISAIIGYEQLKITKDVVKFGI